MPESYQTLAYVAVVIQLSVHHHGDVVRFVPDRLPSAGQINYAQPPHPQRQPGRSRVVYQESFVVRPPVPHRAGHRSHARSGLGAPRDKRNAANSAHVIV